MSFPKASHCTPLECRTECLILRAPRSTDRDSFARLNADPRVMQYFPKHARARRERRAPCLGRKLRDDTLGRIPQPLGESGILGMSAGRGHVAISEVLP